MNQRMKNEIAAASPISSEFEEATCRKIARRLIPFIFLCYIFSFLDRVNVGFAKLQMAGDLQFSDQVYGFGASIFFIGYFIFEVPVLSENSNEVDFMRLRDNRTLGGLQVFEGLNWA